MKKIVLSLALAWMVGCTPVEKMLSTEEERLADSLALHVAVMPTLDCLPFYVAAESGLADSLGLDMRLHTYMAQIDVDTAIQRGRVRVAYSDAIRMLRFSDSVCLKAFMQGCSPMKLFVGKDVMARSVHDLREKMIAVSRLSVSDFWCSAMLDNLFMLQDDVYRPQVHDISIRAEMLRTNKVDAAFLPEPYAQWMKDEGQKELFAMPQDGPQLLLWVVATDRLFDNYRQQQLATLQQIYAKALAEMNARKHDALIRNILVQHYAIDATAADTLQLDIPAKMLPPDPGVFAHSAAFLQSREAWHKQLPADSLIWNNEPH